MKHKIGDKVKVLSRKEIEKTFKKYGIDYYSIYLDDYKKLELIFCDEMFELCDTLVTITGLCDNNPYQYYINNMGFYMWHDCFFKSEPKQLELF